MINRLLFFVNCKVLHRHYGVEFFGTRVCVLCCKHIDIDNKLVKNSSISSQVMFNVNRSDSGF